MSDGSGQDRERARHLMMAALDREIGAGEKAELDMLLSQHTELRAEWQRLIRLKEVTGTMSYRKPPEEVWSHYWTSVYNRFERGMGWMLVSIGVVVLISWGIWEALGEMMADAELPLFVKLAILAVVGGGAFLTVSVLREKLFTRSRDSYKEVQR